MIHLQKAQDQAAWDAFLATQRYPLFLQAWTMGEVYRDIGQEPVRLEVRNDNQIIGICQAIVVPARRGKHLMVQYGPVLGETVNSEQESVNRNQEIVNMVMDGLKDSASQHQCSFLRLSPFWPEAKTQHSTFNIQHSLPSPLHLLSEYTWYIPLRTKDRWADEQWQGSEARSDDDIRAAMRKTTRNLVGRAEREGVTVEASLHPEQDLDIYFELQKETYQRHKFVPYPERFIRAQVKHFAPHNQAIVYIARYQGEPVAASVHMSFGGITSYHHGASTHKHAKIPASYLLQWTAIRDALHRGDDIYNFWGIAPRKVNDDGREEIIDPKHPFAGVTTFKTGFGGNPLPLVHCMDVPLKNSYYVTRAFEFVRKWRRGF